MRSYLVIAYTDEHNVFKSTRPEEVSGSVDEIARTVRDRVGCAVAAGFLPCMDAKSDEALFIPWSRVLMIRLRSDE